ncbi:host specificity factor TipJ family phage tail protein [Rahnella inusitata]|uniref:host specificity factor TipJ family phage tail protein n=1 Tax=Rahnella inusitata TaxID=58169 RepID=UPI0039BE9407
MTIRIYPSRLPGEPLETHQHKAMTIHRWFLLNVKGYDAEKTQPVCLEVDGMAVSSEEWLQWVIGPENDVRIYPIPYAVGFAIASLVIAVAAAAYSIYMMNNLDTASESPAAGDSLQLNSAKANTVKLGDPIREVMGKYRVFPDYVVQPVSRFDSSDPEIFRTSMLLCIGVGNFSIPQSGIRVGSTPASSFGDDVSYTIYQPGANVLSDARSENWWSSTEVGGTSSGSGLDTNSTAPGSVYVNSDAMLFDGNTITLIGVSSSGGEDDEEPSIPSSWVEGTVLTVVAPDSYVISTSGGYSVIYGDLVELVPVVGMPVTLTYNDNNYSLYIASYTEAVPPVPGIGGSAATITASAAPSTYDFSVSSYTFNITWQGVTYTVNLVTNYVNMSGLIDAITDSLTGSGLVAVESSGRVAIHEESSPFTGGTIVNSTLPVEVFGSSPVNVPGVASSGGAAGVQAHITLSYTSAAGAAFSGIPVGTERLSVMYGAGQFMITAIDDTTITVSRLLVTDDGSTVVDSSWPGFNSRTVLDASVSGENDAENWLGPFLACPNGETTTTIENNFIFPNGHIQYKNNGDSQSHSVHVLVQYRNASIGGSWSQVSYDFVGRTPNGHGYTKRISGLPAAQYEIRLRRTTKIGGSKTVNNLYWQALRSRLSKRPTSYAGVTTIALTIRTGNRLASQSDRRVNVEATRLYNGYPSRSISGALMHVMTSLGMNNIDTETIANLESTYWTPRAETFDFEANDSSSSALDILQKITNAGMGYFLLSDGLASAGREGVKSWTGAISPQETTEMLQTAFSAPSEDDYAGVDVTYINGTTWAEETVQCRTAGNKTPRKVESYTLDGVLTADRAYRIGMRRLMKYLQQRLTFSASTEMDALCYNYGDRLILTDDIPGSNTISCLVVSAVLTGSAITLEVSEPLDWNFPNPRVLLRLQDGSATTLLTPNRVDDYTLTIPLTSSLNYQDWVMDDPAIEPPRLIFCSSEQVGYDATVTEISPASDGTCQVTASEYRSEFYAYDDAIYPGDVA